MNRDEKLTIIGGINDFYIQAIPRLGLPVLVMSDGPLGVDDYGPTTAYPAGILLAATWDTELARRAGMSMGKDARARGVHFILAPGMNIYRGAIEMTLLPWKPGTTDTLDQMPLRDRVMAIAHESYFDSMELPGAASELIFAREQAGARLTWKIHGGNPESVLVERRIGKHGHGRLSRNCPPAKPHSWTTNLE